MALPARMPFSRFVEVGNQCNSLIFAERKRKATEAALTRISFSILALRRRHMVVQSASSMTAGMLVIRSSWSTLHRRGMSGAA